MNKSIFILATIFILSVTSITYGQRKRREISLSQADARFTIRAESYYNFVNDESIFYYIQNNTNEKYELVVEVTVSANCQPQRTYKLGYNRIVFLNPNGAFTPKNDWVHNIIGAANAKDCRQRVGDTFTFITDISYKYLSIRNVTVEDRQRAEEITKKRLKN